MFCLIPPFPDCSHLLGCYQGTFCPQMNSLENSCFSVVIASKVMFKLSPEVITTPNGRPPAADEVDSMNMGLLKSSNEDEESTNMISPTCFTPGHERSAYSQLIRSHFTFRESLHYCLPTSTRIVIIVYSNLSFQLLIHILSISCSQISFSPYIEYIVNITNFRVDISISKSLRVIHF